MATDKQKEAFDNAVINGGNISQAMKEAGYSENTAKTPQKLTESDGWKEILEEYLPDSLLAENHKRLFSQIQVDYFMFPKQMKDEDIVAHVASVGIKVITVREGEKGKMAFYAIPDANAIKSALDMAYKLKGKNAPEKSVHLNLNGDIIPNKELETLAHQINEIARSNITTSLGRDGIAPDALGTEAQDQELPGATDGVHESPIHVGSDERHEPAPSVAQAPADRSE